MITTDESHPRYNNAAIYVLTRTRTIKDVQFLGSAHVRAVAQAILGTINYPIPVGFRIVSNRNGNHVIRKVDRRTKQTKKYRLCLIQGDPGRAKAQ
jgi:hypothetical protein